MSPFLVPPSPLLLLLLFGGCRFDAYISGNMASTACRDAARGCCGGGTATPAKPSTAWKKELRRVLQRVFRDVVEEVRAALALCSSLRAGRHGTRPHVCTGIAGRLGAYVPRSGRPWERRCSDSCAHPQVWVRAAAT
jgi:hypothetical protein